MLWTRRISTPSQPVLWSKSSACLLGQLLRRKCSIINERKTSSNFQLIIITHDESFLRKMGQSDVMENYW